MTSSILPQELQSLLQRPSAPPLIPTKPYDPSLTKIIASLSSSHSKATISSLHLLNDDIESAHIIAQANEDSMTSNLVHATLHRRERDFWNSNWWLNQITHPLLDEIHGGKSQACAFVDAVENLVDGGAKGKGGASTACGSKRLDELKEIQWREMVRLVEYSLEKGND